MLKIQEQKDLTLWAILHNTFTVSVDCTHTKIDLFWHASTAAAINSLQIVVLFLFFIIYCGALLPLDKMEYGANGKQSDDNEKIMKFLTEMEVLQRTDPESFSQFLKTMGIDDANSDEAKLGRNTIIDAISQLRAAKNAPSDSEIELPGGQFLSGGEVKAKVHYNIS